MDFEQAFSNQSPIFERGLTFDDVLLVPQYSQILPHEAITKSQVTRNISLKIPILTAAMDSVTESRTAIAIAQAGGLGIIHKNMSIEEQAHEVQIVKRSQAGLITKPVTILVDMTVGDAVALMERHQISGLPVMDTQKSLVGIVTGRDIRFEKSMTRPIHEVMTKEVISVSQDTNAEAAIAILQKHRIEKLPVLSADKKTLIGLFTFKDVEKANAHPNAAKDNRGSLLVGAAVGASGDYLQRAKALLQANCDVLVIDSAHGHSQGVISAVQEFVKLKSQYNFEIIAGNVATAAGAEALIKAGVDAVKVGVGPGSICTTRIIAGIGVPQLSALLNCSSVAKKAGIPIIADGGIKFSGDLVKALAAGASTVMIGNLFAGTEEAPGELIIYKGKSYKGYRGMGSLSAMAKGSKDRYQQGTVEEQGKLVPEGIEGRVPYKGSIASNIYQLVGGLRSGMGYIGAKTIEELHKKAQFMLITSQGLRESHAHDVEITHESPNYRNE